MKSRFTPSLFKFLQLPGPIGQVSKANKSVVVPDRPTNPFCRRECFHCFMLGLGNNHRSMHRINHWSKKPSMGPVGIFKRLHGSCPLSRRQNRPVLGADRDGSGEPSSRYRIEVWGAAHTTAPLRINELTPRSRQYPDLLRCTLSPNRSAASSCATHRRRLGSEYRRLRQVDVPTRWHYPWD